MKKWIKYALIVLAFIGIILVMIISLNYMLLINNKKEARRITMQRASQKLTLDDLSKNVLKYIIKKEVIIHKV